jgi:hypothetical protein
MKEEKLNKSNLTLVGIGFWIVLLTLFIPGGVHRSQSATNSPTPQSTASVLSEHDCYARFTTFAYGIPSNLQTGIRGNHAPSLPWINYTYLPHSLAANQNGLNDFSLITARNLNGAVELWIKRDVTVAEISLDSYKPPVTTSSIHRLSQKVVGWEEVDDKPVIPSGVAVLSGYEYRLDQIVTVSDSEIWATYTFTGAATTSQQGITSDSTVRILAKFNDATKRFELVESSRYTTVGSLEHDYFTPDRNGMLWLYVPQDGIYKFDPRANRLTKELSTPDRGEETRVYIAPSGNIYFNSLEKNTAGGMFLVKNVLKQFDPATRTIREIAMPDSSLEWPLFRVLLETRTGKLYADAAMVREPDGKWHLMIPDLAAFRALSWRYKDYGGRELPVPILESRDGRIWFNVGYSDGAPRLEGTAWYDPDAREGCMFTTSSAAVIEDPAGYVWTIFDNRLYRREPSRIVP